MLVIIVYHCEILTTYVCSNLNNDAENSVTFYFHVAVFVYKEQAKII